MRLDLRQPGDREQILDWVSQADVVLEGETPGTLASLGFDFATLRRHAPGLILNSITWYGQSGPDAQNPSFDGAIFAQIGLAKGIGPVEGPPLLPSGYAAQVLGGINGFTACMQRLIGDILSGERSPAHLDISILESTLVLTDLGPIAYLNVGATVERLGLNRFGAQFPAGIYETQER